MSASEPVLLLRLGPCCYIGSSCANLSPTTMPSHAITLIISTLALIDTDRARCGCATNQGRESLTLITDQRPADPPHPWCERACSCGRARAATTVCLLLPLPPVQSLAGTGPSRPRSCIRPIYLSRVPGTNELPKARISRHRKPPTAQRGVVSRQATPGETVLDKDSSDSNPRISNRIGIA